MIYRVEDYHVTRAILVRLLLANSHTQAWRASLGLQHLPDCEGAVSERYRLCSTAARHIFLLLCLSLRSYSIMPVVRVVAGTALGCELSQESTASQPKNTKISVSPFAFSSTLARVEGHISFLRCVRKVTRERLSSRALERLPAFLHAWIVALLASRGALRAGPARRHYSAHHRVLPALLSRTSTEVTIDVHREVLELVRTASVQY